MGSNTGGLPSGTVTFLFTDIESSTVHWSEAPDAMAASLRVHDEVIRGVVSTVGGHVFATGGDGFAIAFARPSDAVSVALEAQAALASTRWPGPALRVRMGMHLGEADERGGDYFGPSVNTAARIMAAGHGGQVLASGLVCGAIEGSAATTIDLGELRLKGVTAPVRLSQLGDGSFRDLVTVDDASRATSLPASRTRLIERADSVAEVVELVDEYPLVTLTGSGGSGKTRLAIAVAHQLVGTFTGGAWFVDLSPIADAGAVLVGLGLVPDGVTDAIEQISTFVRPRRCLILLDNCEHVVDGAADLIEAISPGADDLRDGGRDPRPAG